MIIAILIVFALLFMILTHGMKIPMGDCICGGIYYYDFYDGELDKNVYKCHRCGNKVI
jgi:hypothetical protein